jgi:hypothetical protein
MSSWTVSLWFRAESGSGATAGQVFSHEIGALYQFTTTGTVPNRYLQVVYESFPSVTVRTQGTTNIANDTAYHVVYTYDRVSGKHKIYLNGVEESYSTSVTDSTAEVQRGYHFFAINATITGASVSDLAIWDRALTQAEITNIYAGSTKYLTESSANRFNRIASTSSLPSNLYQTSTTTVATCGVYDLQEGNLLSALQKVSDTEQGLLFADASNILQFKERYYVASLITPSAYFSDEVGDVSIYGLAPMLYDGLTFTYDADQLANTVTVTTGEGLSVTNQNVESINNYGRRSMSFDTLLTTVEIASGISQGLVELYKNPILRAESFDVYPETNPAVYYPQLLSLELGKRMILNRTPMDIGNTIQQPLAVQQIKHEITPSNWKVTLLGTSRPTQKYFVLDSSSLDGTDILGF